MAAPPMLVTGSVSTARLHGAACWHCGAVTAVLSRLELWSCRARVGCGRSSPVGAAHQPLTWRVDHDCACTRLDTFARP